MTERTRTELTPSIYAHHHVWDLGVRDQPWTTGLAPLRRSFSIADLTSSYDEVLAAARDATSDLSAAERQALFAGTATRFYRLPA